VPRLAVFLLGPPRLELDDEVVQLDRRKALALLAYLAVTGQSHRRDSLVNLLWPDLDGPSGRAALRRTLHALSSALGAAWLDAGREEICLNIGSPAPSRLSLWVDVIDFHHHLAACATHGHPPTQVCPSCVAPLAEAVALTCGEFLSGFGLKDSFNFDDWQLFQAEALRRDLLEALDRLVHWHSAQREFEPALAYARRRLALDPLDEQAHQQLMRLFAWSGRRSAALHQFDDCTEVLRDQLGVPPQDETRRLHHEIQAGRPPPLPSTADAAAAPASLSKPGQEVERPVFVARERELAQLDGFLELALAGQGRVAFVTGEAGSGKTALIQAFASRAQAAHPDLVVAGGRGNAHTGSGDPYLPFREILCLLTGDVAAQQAARVMTREQAERLRRLMPLAVHALVKAGPDLIDLFVAGEALLERSRMVKPWPAEVVPLSRLEEQTARRLDPTSAIRMQQSALFEQYARVLHELAASHPLLVALDDLQWADGGSLSLLFHLGRRLGGSRILLIGAYRPAEVALGRPLTASAPPSADEETDDTRGRHPLESIVNELKRTFGPIEIDLEQGEGRRFVDAFLDSEPNHLGGDFRRALCDHTLGHPLFTVELLRGMQERGDLARDAGGAWVEGSALDWETLPARVEAVIAERIGRLPHRLRRLLSVASAEGETFTAEVVAQVLAAGEQEVIQSLSAALDRRHRLVSTRGVVRAGSQRLSQYRFRHILYQRYLYGTLDEVERVHLHEQIGATLEGLYAGQDSAPIAIQLARHFQEAGIVEKAVRYLHQAGMRAVQMSAYQEGLAHVFRALSLLATQPESPERDRKELELRLVQIVAIQGVRGTQSPEMRDACVRARELCLAQGETSRLCEVLGNLSLHHFTRAEHQAAREFGEQSLRVARGLNDSFAEALGCWSLGVVLFSLGDFEAAQAHLERTIAFYVPEEHHRLFLHVLGSDAGVSAMAYSACALWCLGYPDQALRRSREALALGRQLDHAFTLADVLTYGCCLFSRMRRDTEELRDRGEELVSLARDRAPVWKGTGEGYLGEALVRQGHVQDGMALLRESMAILQSREVRIDLPIVLASLAEAQARALRPEEGLVTLSQALALVARTDERHHEAELHRLRAELLLMCDDVAEAEASLLQAIEVASRQSARSWELRAATSLARLWQAQGRVDEARRLLSDIYCWFTEGFDTPSLQEARALLEELG